MCSEYVCICGEGQGSDTRNLRDFNFKNILGRLLMVGTLGKESEVNTINLGSKSPVRTLQVNSYKSTA